MASRVALAWEDLGYQSVKVTSSPIGRPGFPAINVTQDDPGEVWRGELNVTQYSIIFDLGSTKTVAAFYVGFANLTSTGIWSVRCDLVDSSGATGAAYNSFQQPWPSPIYDRAFRIPPAPVVCRYVRIQFIDTSLPQLEVGLIRLFANCWNPSRGVKFGLRDIYRDHSSKRVSPMGAERGALGPIQRGRQFSMPAVDNANFDTYADPLIRFVGHSRDMLVCMDTAATDLGKATYYGRLETVPEFEQFAFNARTVDFRIWDKVG